MAELADALVSGISDRTIMQVQVLFPAPAPQSSVLRCFLFQNLCKNRGSVLYLFSIFSLVR